MDIETLIIGGGQAGLTMSHALSKRGRPHLVLERGRIAERWRSERWDGLHFQTPNALVRLPDFPLISDAPDGYATGAEIAAYLDAYAAFIRAPIRCGVSVTALRPGFVAETSAGLFRAANVVVATGPFQTPIIPPLLPETSSILQLHASAYKAQSALPEGAVLVVGAGASGAQIADELLRSGRRVFFSVGKHKRAPRRYRGQDHVWWWIETGMDKTPPERRPADHSPPGSSVWGPTLPDQRPNACTISSVIFFASPNSIIVFGRKNSSLSTPAYPDAIDRFTNSTVAAFSTSRMGIP